MDIIALTGRNPRTMTDAGYLLLELTGQAGHAVSVVLLVQTANELHAMRASGHHVALWRIGHDDTRPRLDAQLDAWINDDAAELAPAVRRELDLFLCRCRHATTLPPKGNP